MKLASVTISNNSCDMIADAILSVIDWVDECIIIDTGITDDTIDVARSIAGDKLYVEKWDWGDDFAAARNHSLDIATSRGADYAFIIDTDERISTNGDDIKNIILNSKPNIISYSMLCSEGTYGKIRCVRLPCSQKYVGPTHEVMISPHPDNRMEFPKARFWEIPKTNERLRSKFERDIRILSKHVKTHPGDPRWHYYLGDSYRNLGRFEDAIISYETCWSINGWDEESAWSMYQCAQCWISLENYKKAIECCARGMSRHPGIAELPWLAGWCSYKLGDFQKAVYWSKISIAAGNFEGFGNEVVRIGFRYPPALWESPYDVLRWSLKSLNKKDDEYYQEIEEKFRAALEIRNVNVT